MTVDHAAPTAGTAFDTALSVVCLGHDLRAALAEVRSSLQLIEDLDLPDDLRDPICRCRAVGEDLARLVDQAVLVCLGQGSAVAMRPVLVETGAFLAALHLRWEGRSRETGHSFRLIEAGALPRHLWIDRTALERVLANLISNALDHSDPGTVTVTVKTSGGDLLLIVVEDDGPGFPVDHLPSIQRDFALPPEARRPGGGFGLPSVRLLVEAMGGRCNLRNKASGGAEVGVCLPLADLRGHDAQNPPTVPTLALPPNLGGTRLLMADDSASSRELVTALARQIGASIQTVPDGKAVIDALRRGPLPDVLILDDEMPGATGLEVLGWLQAAGGALAALPVVALTSHIGAAEVAALQQAGAREVLSKPVLCRLELGRAILHAQGHDARLPADAQADLPPEARTLAHLCQLAGPDAAGELFENLHQDLSGARTGLARAAAQRDLNNIRAHSHVIIALAGTAGATALHQDAVMLNGMAHENEPPERIVALAERLDGAIGELIETVHRMTPAHGSGDGGRRP